MAAKSMSTPTDGGPAMRKQKPKPSDFGDSLKALIGLPVSRELDLARPMRVDVGRIGYADEGLRLTFSIGSPYKFNAEVQLSRADAEWLVARLRAELADPRNANLPKGPAHAD
jgi:hypothetical protein